MGCDMFMKEGIKIEFKDGNFLYLYGGKKANVNPPYYTVEFSNEDEAVFFQQIEDIKFMRRNMKDKD